MSIRDLAERGTGKHLYGRKYYRNLHHQVQPISGAWNHNENSPKPWLVTTREDGSYNVKRELNKGIGIHITITK